MTDVLRREFALACPPARAFRAFTEQVDLWWPPRHRRYPGGTLQFADDRLIDRDADGGEWVMAQVLAQEPPHQLSLLWFPGSPQAPTEVEIHFAAERDGTLVSIVHRAGSAANDIWTARIETFRSGWEAVSISLAEFAGDGASLAI